MAWRIGRVEGDVDVGVDVGDDDGYDDNHDDVNHDAGLKLLSPFPFTRPQTSAAPRRAANMLQHSTTQHSTAQSRASSTQRSHSPSITILPYNISALRPHTLNLGNHLNQIALQKFATNTMRTQSESQLCRTCRIKVSSSPSPRRVLSAVQCCVVLCSAVVEKG